LPDTAVQETRERAAVKSSSCVFPQLRITVSLAPSDLKGGDGVVGGDLR
jgi:predicted ATPase with chaperone activity